MTTSSPGAASTLPPLAVMSRFDGGMPALCGYPSANRLVEAIGSDDVARALGQRRHGAMPARGVALGVQVGISCCERPGDICSCTPVLTRRHACAQSYLQGLRTEAMLAAGAMDGRQAVSRIHVGDAAALFMSDDQLASVIALLRQLFLVASDAEISISAAESLCTPDRLVRLRAGGFNRLVFELDADGGVNDGEARLVELAKVARQTGFGCIAVDLGSGSRQSTAATLGRNVALVLAMRPDRIRIVRQDDPASHAPVASADATADAPSRWQQAARRRTAFERLLCAGYQHLGLGEFALPSDPVAVACRQGRLHPGLHGFGVKADGDVLALGLSAAGRVGSIVYRNVDGLSRFYGALARGGLPVARGLALNRDELARKGVITGLVCQGRVDFESISLSHLIDMRTHFAREFALLEPLVQAGLVDVDREAIELSAVGRWFAPVVAAIFDRELQRDVQRKRPDSLA